MAQRAFRFAAGLMRRFLRIAFASASRRALDIDLVELELRRVRRVRFFPATRFRARERATVFPRSADGAERASSSSP